MNKRTGQRSSHLKTSDKKLQENYKYVDRKMGIAGHHYVFSTVFFLGALYESWQQSFFHIRKTKWLHRVLKKEKKVNIISKFIVGGWMAKGPLAPRQVRPYASANTFVKKFVWDFDLR